MNTKDKVFNGDIVVSTIPLNRIINKIRPSPEKTILNSANKLEYLSLILVYLNTKKKNILNCEYCYFVDRPYNRISEMDFITGNMNTEDENLLIVEISCHYQDKMWNYSNEEVFSLCIDALEKDNLLKKENILHYEIIKVPSVYPIYRKDYEIHLKEVEKYFFKINNFFSIGRQGQFYYGDSDQMIRIGFDTADKIIKQ